MVLQDWQNTLEFTEVELRQMGASVLGAQKTKKKKRKKGWMSVPEDGMSPSGGNSGGNEIVERKGSQAYRDLSEGLDSAVEAAFDAQGDFTPSLPVMASGALQSLDRIEKRMEISEEPVVGAMEPEESKPPEVPVEQTVPLEEEEILPKQQEEEIIPITVEALSDSGPKGETPPVPPLPKKEEKEESEVHATNVDSGELSEREKHVDGVFKAYSAMGSVEQAGEASSNTAPPPMPAEAASQDSNGDASAKENTDSEEVLEAEKITEPQASGSVVGDQAKVGKETLKMAPPPPVPQEVGQDRKAAPPPVPKQEGAKAAPPPVPATVGEEGPKEAPSKRKEESKGAPPPVPALQEAESAESAESASPGETSARKSKPKQGKKKKRKVRRKAWYEDFFNDDYLLTLPYETPEATASEAEFIDKQLALPGSSRLLDLGCGYGRHAVEMARRGYKVVGLDNSLPMLLKAAEMGEQHGVEVNFMHGDMKEMTFQDEFDGVYCFNTSFGYFDDDTNRKVLRHVFKALKEKGQFLLEVVNRDFLLTDLPLRVWWEGNGCVVMEEVDFNYFTSRVESNRSVVFNDGRQVEHKLSIRVYSLHELGKLLYREGFIVKEVTGNLATPGRFFGPESPYLIIKTEKKKK